MANFSMARLLDVLVRGRIAEPAPAAELVNELEEQMSGVLAEYPTQDRLSLEIGQVLRAIAELKQSQAEMEARLTQMMAELESRMTRLVLQALGIALGAVALAVGIILGFG